MDTFENAKTFFEHAHMVMPRLGFGANPRWEVAEYEGEPILSSFRTLDRLGAQKEIHRAPSPVKPVMELNINLSWLGVVRPSKGRAVVEQKPPIGHVQGRRRKR